MQKITFDTGIKTYQINDSGVYGLIRLTKSVQAVQGPACGNRANPKGL